MTTPQQPRLGPAWRGKGTGFQPPPAVPDAKREQRSSSDRKNPFSALDDDEQPPSSSNSNEGGRFSSLSSREGFHRSASSGQSKPCSLADLAAAAPPRRSTMSTTSHGVVSEAGEKVQDDNLIDVFDDPSSLPKEETKQNVQESNQHNQSAQHERRGSGFLLLAAEAMERTELRENAIRRAAMQLNTASTHADENNTCSTRSPSNPDYSTRLQHVFGMPSLHADQISCTTCATAVHEQHQQSMSWPTSSSLPTAPLIIPSQTSNSKEKDNSNPSATTSLTTSGRPRPPQKHVYHDYASLPIPSVDPSNTSPSRKKSGGVTQPFPDKLMLMLDQESIQHPDIVSWLPHGRAFLVRKPKVFTNEIMSIYFRQSKLTSFQRQLNLYGFRRITQGADGGAYYHELFLRGRPNLCARMVRQKVKGTGHKQPTDVTSEPNFYAMPSILPCITTANSHYITPTPSYQPQTNVDGNNQEYNNNSLLNSPGIQAATLLKRLSSVGTPSQFSLDEVNNPG